MKRIYYINLQKVFIIIFLSIFFKGMFGQVPIQRDASGNVTNLSQMKVTNAVTDIKFEGIDPTIGRIDYSRIKGSPFWKDTWMKAFLFDHRDTALGSFKIRVNLATNEIHFLDLSGEEQVVIPGMLNAVIFMREDDSTKTASIFRANIPEVKKKASCKNCFTQELNQGFVRLLKITQRQLKAKDSLFGTMKSYYFADAEEYIVQSGQQYHRIKRLNKETIFTFIPGASAYDAWIREKNLRFKNESDYLLFFDHYNATHKKDE